MTPHDPAALVAATAEEVVAADAARAERVALLRRRMQLALCDSGLGAIVGCDWAMIGDDGFEFTALAARQSDALVRFLENVGNGVMPRTGNCRDQLWLF